MPIDPLLHSQATGIHPGAYVQPSAPANPYTVAGRSYAMPHGVLWVDTSSGPPFQLKMWHAGRAVWLPVGVVAAGLGQRSAGFGDLLWYDGQQWQLVSTDGAPGNVLTEVATGAGLQPLWSTPVAPTAPPTVPVPAPPVDANLYRCAIAQWLGGKLEQAYSLAAAIMQAEAGHDLSLLQNIAGGVIGFTAEFRVVHELIDEVFGPLAYVPGLATGFIVTLAKAYLSWSLLPVPPAAQDDVVRALYCNMAQASDGSWPIDAAVLDGWRHAIVAGAIAGDFVAPPVGAQVSQQLVLEELVGMISLYQWQLWAHAASQTQSSLCADYSCTGLIPAALTGALSMSGGAMIGTVGISSMSGGAMLAAAGRTSMTGGATYPKSGGFALTGGAAL